MSITNEALRYGGSTALITLAVSVPTTIGSIALLAAGVGQGVFAIMAAPALIGLSLPIVAIGTVALIASLFFATISIAYLFGLNKLADLGYYKE